MNRPSMDSIVETAALRLRDKMLISGSQSAEYMAGFTQALIEELMKYYSLEETCQYLERKGMKPNLAKLQDGTMKPREGKRIAAHTQREYLGDGTYMLRGVRFGEPRNDLIDRIWKK